MTKPTRWLTVGAALVGLCITAPHPATPAQAPESAPQNAKSFQLVYHSDDRGYYRPCG